MPDVTTVSLGAEYDQELRNNLGKVLKNLGAKKLHKVWRVSGSQEVLDLKTEIQNHAIHIQSETYFGIKVSGSQIIIDVILKELDRIQT